MTFLPVHIVNGVAPVVFIMPAKTTEAHANINPGNLHKRLYADKINCLMYLKPQIFQSSYLRRQYTFIPEISALMWDNTDLSKFARLLRFQPDLA